MNTNHTYKNETSEYIVLSNQVPYKQFEFSNADFKLEIISAKFLIDPMINWVQLLPQFEIWVYLIGYSELDNNVLQTVKYSNLLHLYNNPYSKKPIFQLNKLVDKQVFGSKVNLCGVTSFGVKIELIEKVSINEIYTLHLEIIK